MATRLALVGVCAALLRVLSLEHALHWYVRALVHVASMRVHVTIMTGLPAVVSLTLAVVDATRVGTMQMLTKVRGALTSLSPSPIG